jgi:hypothetical protein
MLRTHFSVDIYPIPQGFSENQIHLTVRLYTNGVMCSIRLKQVMKYWDELKPSA